MKRLIAVGASLMFLATIALAQWNYPGQGNNPGNWNNANYQQYRGRLSPGDQSRYDSYFQRWLNSKTTNDNDQIRSMEKRMQDIMRSYNIPYSVPYEVLASNYNGNYGGGWNNNYAGRFSAHDQNVYDQLYVNWLQAHIINNQSQISKAESAMQTVMRKYGIPTTVDYGSLASPNVQQGGGGGGGWYSSLRILSASYGNGWRRSDVTGRLQSQIQNGRLSIRVTNDTMGGDPAPKQQKQLQVTYSVNNGRNQSRNVNEGGYLTLP
jgi:hypothetical protein